MIEGRIQNLRRRLHLAIRRLIHGNGKTPYGMELLLDLHRCANVPCDRAFLEDFFKKLCDLIKVERGDLHFWDYEGEPFRVYLDAPDHVKGSSSIQFILTSNVTVHSLDVPRSVYLNVFSCDTFDPEVVADFAAGFFKGTVASKTVVDRM